MLKLRSINAKFQILLMLVLLIIIFVSNIITQNITASYLLKLVYDELNQRVDELKLFLKPNLFPFNVSRLSSQSQLIINKKRNDFIALFNPDKVLLLQLGFNNGITLPSPEDFRSIKEINHATNDYILITIPIFSSNTDSPSFYIMYGRSLLDNKRAIASIQKYCLLVSALIYILAGFILRYIIKRTTRPIKTINKGFEMVTNGNMSYRLPIVSSDELGFLAAKFNLMAEQLETIMTELSATQKDLESQVILQTNELNSANEKLRDALAELKYTQKKIIQTETQKSLTSIVSGFAHEINNPLTGILGYIDLIELNDSLPHHSKRRLEGIKDQALRIKDVIDELNQLDPEIEQSKLEINLANLLEKLVKIIKKNEDHSGIEFEVLLPNDEIIVFGNHFSLWQVFEGIIENSIEAIKDGNIYNGHIRVTLAIDPESDAAVTEITDNGGGFKNLDKAFNPFYTTRNRTKKRGIGLSIAFNLIQEHKGTISIRNADEGAAVKVILPFHQRSLFHDNRDSLDSESIEYE
jgi:signal transduction histidine kinase